MEGIKMTAKRPKIDSTPWGYPTKEFQQYQHERSQENLEAMRKKLGDENFFIYCMGVIKDYGNMDANPLTVADACENWPRMLNYYIIMAKRDVDKKEQKSKEVI
jgi:hypothetical protein